MIKKVPELRPPQKLIARRFAWVAKAPRPPVKKTRTALAQITSSEVFTDFDEEAYDDALRRARDLLAGNGLVGMAFHKYQSVNISYEDALQKFYE